MASVLLLSLRTLVVPAPSFTKLLALRVPGLCCSLRQQTSALALRSGSSHFLKDFSPHSSPPPLPHHQFLHLQGGGVTSSYVQTYSFVVFRIFTQAQLPARPMAQLPARTMAHTHIHITPASPSAASAVDTGNSILMSLHLFGPLACSSWRLGEAYKHTQYIVWETILFKIYVS